jgi:hypothetical protein
VDKWTSGHGILLTRESKHEAQPCVGKKVSRTGLRVEFKGFTGIELGDGFKESVLGLHARRLA